MGKTYHDNPNLLVELLSTDFIRKLEPLFNKGFQINPATGKLTDVWGAEQINQEAPWIYVNPLPDADCEFYSDIFKNCEFIPNRCLSCWKVVVRPSSLTNLLKLYELQLCLVEENPNCWCKCGWEDRPWVFGNYGGYFYCKSKEVGLQRLETVRKAVADYIGKSLAEQVFLKRFCTEYELRLGDSAKYERKPEDDIMEAAIIEGSETTIVKNPQPESVRNHIMANWILKAYKIGDPTSMFYNNSKPLYKPSRRYEK